MVIAGIVAGGTGSRMESDRPKQFLALRGKPVIIHSIERFLSAPEVDHIIVGVHPEWTDHMKTLIEKYFDKDIAVVEGGNDRNETLCRIISAARELYDPGEDSIFLTHDAVRPFITRRMIVDNIAACREYGVCGTVIPATDTIIHSADNETISTIPPRKQMYQAQTPQSFTLERWNEAIKSLTPEQMREATDACRLFRECDIPVRLVMGGITNIKITYPSDLILAEAIADTFDYNG